MKLFTKSSRESSMEMLRIIAIGMVVALHYIARLAEHVDAPFNYYSMEFLRQFCIIGVNCFVLLSGYFGIYSKGLKLRRIVNLLLTIAFLGATTYIAAALFGIVEFSIKDLIVSCAPYVKGSLWFIRVYIVLEFLVPFLNIGLHQLSSKQYAFLVIVLLIFFSIWPSFLPNPLIADGGFGIVHFIVLYIIGGYLQLHFRFTLKWWYYLLIFITCTFLGFSCIIIGWPLTNHCYDFFFNILSACSLLMMFSSWHFKSGFINFVASTAFGVYIIHDGGAFANILYNNILRLESVAASPYCFLFTIVSICAQTIVCMIIISLQILLFRVTIDRIVDKIPWLNKTIFDFNQ